MKRFEMPKMNIQRLEAEDVMRTSGCWESFDCQECYGLAVVCDGVYNCSGLVCPCLGALNI